MKNNNDKKIRNVEINSEELKFFIKNNSESSLNNILRYKLGTTEISSEELKETMVIINDLLTHLKNKQLFEMLIESNNLIFILEYSNQLFNSVNEQKFSIDIFSLFTDSSNNDNFWILVFEHKNLSKEIIKNYKYKLILEAKKKEFEDKIERIAWYFNENAKLRNISVNVLSCLFIRESSLNYDDKNNYLNGKFVNNLNNIFSIEGSKTLNYINSFLKSARGHNYLASFLSEEKNLYTFIDDTIYEHINSEIHQNNNQGSLVFHIEGIPGSGKTAMAIEFLKFIPNSYLLLLNRNFALDIINDIKQNSYKSKILTYWDQVRNIMTSIKDKKSIFLIVDECQRLSANKPIFDDEYTISGYNDQITNLNDWINDGLNLILLGDNEQTINKRDYKIDLNNDFPNRKNKDKNRIFKLKNGSYRLPVKFINKIKYSLGFINDRPQKVNSNFYSIEFYEPKNLDFFMSDYKKDEDIIKIISKVTTSFMQKTAADDKETIKNYIFKRFHSLYGNDHAELGNSLSKTGNFDIRKDNYNILWFDPYELISREIDEAYLYIKLTKDEFLQNFSQKEWNEKKSGLYVLLTRATKKLHIYFEDQELYEYCKKRLDECS